VQLTLHPGDRIPLDHISNPSPRPECRAVGLGLDVRLARAAGPSSVTTSMIPIGATAGGAKPVDAELWLLHTLPSGTVQVLHQIVRVPAAGGQFGFPATTVETTRGSVNVQMAGSIDRYRSPAGTEFVILSLNRLVTGEGLPAEGVSAITSSVQAMPTSPADVLSFEMPGTAGRGGGGRGGARVAGGPPPVGGTMSAAAGGRGADPQTGTGSITARSGGRGAAGAAMAPVAVLLEGHQFALRVRITQVN